MTKRVVDPLEAVEVEQRHDELTLRVLQVIAQRELELPPIADSRKRIERCFFAHARELRFEHGDLRHESFGHLTPLPLTFFRESTKACHLFIESCPELAEVP